MTTYRCDTSSRLTEIDQPSGETITFGYDPNGQRDQKTVTTAGPNPATYHVNDTYQNGQLAAQTTLGGALLATFSYDPAGVPESVVVGANASTGPRYYYVYNGHGDVVALSDSSGNIVASYSYDVWGNLTASSENIPNANGWTNPYRYDGRDGARYDTETGLYWLSTRAYDPTLGRFLQRDPLGRASLFFSDQPYAYAGNNPLINVDPAGERYYDGEPETAAQQIAETRRTQQVMRIYWMHPREWWHSCSNPNDDSSTCKTWRKWDDHASMLKHIGSVAALVAGIGLITLGALIGFVGIVWVLYKGSGDLARDVVAVEAALLAFTKILNGVSAAVPSSIAPLFRLIYALMDAVLAVVHVMAAIIAQWGVLGITTVRAILLGSQVATESEAAPLMLLIQQFAGTAVGFGLIALGYGLDMLGQGSIFLHQKIDAASPEDFCRFIAVVCGAEPASGYMAY